MIIQLNYNKYTLSGMFSNNFINIIINKYQFLSNLFFIYIQIIMKQLYQQRLTYNHILHIHMFILLPDHLLINLQYLKYYFIFYLNKEFSLNEVTVMINIYHINSLYDINLQIANLNIIYMFKQFNHHIFNEILNYDFDQDVLNML